MRRNTLTGLAVVLLILAAMAAKSLLVSIPDVRASNPPGQFDAQRAKARLAHVLGDQRPHPVDSDGNDAVRARLVAELQSMGLKPIVRDQSACNDFQKARLVACARVRNVIALLGPPTGKALLLNAHYDSVPVAPGAGDDGVGVASLLEVASILKDRPLKRPIILLFNEGEELGLLGARAFLGDPLSRSVDSLLNFEARGVSGPVTMFQTSAPNGPAVSAFAQAVDRPFASSLMTDMLRLLPNDTDVSTFNDRGWTTLNFAMVGNETRYHSGGDDLAALDTRSLQHMGDQALAMSKQLSSGVPQARGDHLFIDVLGRWLIQMPQWLGFALYALLLFAFGLAAWRRGRLPLAAATIVGALVLGSAGGWLASVILGLLRHGIYWRANPDLSFFALYVAALSGALVPVLTIGRRLSVRQLRAGFWLVFLMLGGLLAFAAPGGVIYFLFPPLIALGGIALERRSATGATIAGLLALLALYLTWGEMLTLFEQLFSPGPIWPAVLFGSIIIVAALVEAAPVVAAASRGALLLASSAATFAAAVAVLASPAYSADRQQQFTVEHAAGFPSGKSQWSLLTDGAALPETLKRLGSWRLGTLPYSKRKRWLSDAPAIAGIKPPQLQPVEIVTNGNERTLRLRLIANGAERIMLIAPAAAHVESAGVSGFVRPTGSGEDGDTTLVCSGRNCDGTELTLVQQSAKPLTLDVIGTRRGLPPSAVPLLQARPRFARPQYTPDETVAYTKVKI